MANMIDYIDASGEIVQVNQMEIRNNNDLLARLGFESVAALEKAQKRKVTNLVGVDAELNA